MVYILLNVFVCGLLIFIANLIDKTVRTETYDTSGLSIALLLSIVQNIIFTLILILKDFWLDKFTNQIMKFSFAIDGISLVMLSFAFIVIGCKKENNLFRIVRFLLFAFVAFVACFKFTYVSVDFQTGVTVTSNYLFSGAARDYFPVTWTWVYFILTRFFIPGICYLGLFVMEENNPNQLERYQTIVLGNSILLLWISFVAMQFITSAYPSFNLLSNYCNLFMYVLIYAAIVKTNVPSGKGVFVIALRIFLTYLVPSAMIGVFCVFVKPFSGQIDLMYTLIMAIVSFAVVAISVKMNFVLSKLTRVYAADYEPYLEKDLATIDYSETEMDIITDKMFDVIKRNVEVTEMSVFIINSSNVMEMAYNSTGAKLANIPVSNNPVFECLLNLDRKVVTKDQIDIDHNISGVKEGLKELFENTKAECILMLNEGHNIFGLIVLGKKLGGDIFKESDINIFNRLYSYFFVFGYYMRNISNKEIMGIVNREIKMSSQIITSIQENIDTINNPKIDVGYLMVPAHNIGGEFIDIIRLTDKRYLFIVGDLSGKGIAASMNMVILKSIIRSYLAETHDFKQLVVKVNEFVRNSLRKGTIFAGLFAIIDFESDTMYYINCGIPALFSYTQVYNNVIEIQGSGHILGFVKDISPYISVKSTKLNRGDIILACTDGMIQSHSLRGEQYGKERVQQALLDNSTYPAKRMADFTFDNLTKFMSKEMEDDVSILVIKYETAAKFVDEEKTKAEESKDEEPKTEEASPVAEEAAVSENTVETEPVKEQIVEKEAETEEEESFFTEDNSVETSHKSYEEKEAKLQEEVSHAENKETVAPEEEKKVVIQHDAPPEGFDSSELDDLDAMLSDIGL